MFFHFDSWMMLMFGVGRISSLPTPNLRRFTLPIFPSFIVSVPSLSIMVSRPRYPQEFNPDPLADTETQIWGTPLCIAAPPVAPIIVPLFYVGIHAVWALDLHADMLSVIPVICITETMDMGLHQYSIFSLSWSLERSNPAGNTVLSTRSLMSTNLSQLQNTGLEQSSEVRLPLSSQLDFSLFFSLGEFCQLTAGLPRAFQTLDLADPWKAIKIASYFPAEVQF